MSAEFWALGIAFGAIALVFFWTLLTGSPPTPTSAKVRRTVIAQLPKRLPGDAAAHVYELGAGWGGLAASLARAYPDHPVYGIEMSPLPWLVARLRQAILGPPNLKIRLGDFRNRDLSAAALVVCYLSADGLERVRPKLETDLKDGALVLSHTFAIPGWRPNDRSAADDLYRSPVYLYEMSSDMAADYRSGDVASLSQSASAPSRSGDSSS